ncbi:MAG TPA: hypothetical protein VGQ57_19300 [Polyangiaceae bacterium]|jgi:hypothetical protein|nr:hypothetical protein [Polyangiaceae bacterium]
MSHRHRPAVVLALVLAAHGLGCSAENQKTAGKRVILRTAMSAAPVATTFTTGFGWDVTLEAAAVALNGLYYFDGTPPTARLQAPRPAWRDRLTGLFIGTAWAHPGHYQAGTALGQVMFDEPRALDLFSPPGGLPDGDGVTGTYRSARFVLPPAAPRDAVLEGHLALAIGTATAHDEPSGKPVHFKLVADPSDIAQDVNDGAVDGCVFDETNVEGDGTVTFDVKPTVWLNLVDFSKLAPGSEDEPTEAHDAGFSQGVAQLSAYHFAFSH